MNSDIRLSLGFFSHPKTIKLQRRLGLEGVLCLQRLWCFTAQHHCSGVLDGMDDEEVAIAAGWSNDPLTFVGTLVEIRWLDRIDGVVSVHDWLEHNGWASGADDRSDKARFSRMARLFPAIFAELKARGVDAISASEYKRLTAATRSDSTTVERPLNESLEEPLTNRSTPLPSPSPSPSLKPSPALVLFTECFADHADFIAKHWPHVVPDVEVAALASYYAKLPLPVDPWIVCDRWLRKVDKGDTHGKTRRSGSGPAGSSRKTGYGEANDHDANWLDGA